MIPPRLHGHVVNYRIMHAGALTEFFMGKKKNAAAVYDLVDSQYQLLSPSAATALFANVSNQMSHLQVRPTKEEDKVRPNEKDMLHLEDEIERFQRHLRTEYRELFVLNSTRPNTALPA